MRKDGFANLVLPGEIRAKGDRGNNAYASKRA